MQQTAWRVIRYLPRRCRGDHTGLRGRSQSWFCWHGPQLIRMLHGTSSGSARRHPSAAFWHQCDGIQGAAPSELSRNPSPT